VGKNSQLGRAIITDNTHTRDVLYIQIRFSRRPFFRELFCMQYRLRMKLATRNSRRCLELWKLWMLELLRLIIRSSRAATEEHREENAAAVAKEIIIPPREINYYATDYNERRLW